MTNVLVPASPQAAAGGTPGKSHKELAIWSLICAILVLPPAGVIMGVIARRNMRASNNPDGRNIASAAIIIGAIYSAFDVFLTYQSNQPLADWITGAINGSVPLYIVLQIWFGYSWSGRWRIATLVPLIVFIPVLIYSLAGLAQGSNLWPLPLIFLSPLGVVHLLVVRAPTQSSTGGQLPEEQWHTGGAHVHFAIDSILRNDRGRMRGCGIPSAFPRS